MIRLVPRLASVLLLSTVPILSAQTNAAPPPAPPVPANVLVQQDIVFGQGGTHDLHANLAWPRGATSPLPAIIHIHGGGWISGTYKSGPEIHYAQNGYFAASIEYRLDNVAKWPAQIQDCKLAVRWLRANAARYNIDPNRIGVIGESAGGHLVACLATMTDPQYENDQYPGVSDRVQAVVDFYGPTDFITPQIYSQAAKHITEGLFGVAREQNPALWKSGSPVFYVAAGDPPVLLIHGASDSLVPLAQSQVFAAALTKAGVPNQLLVIQHAGHGLPPDPGTKIDPPWSVINQTILDFYARYIGPPQKPAP